MHGTVALIHGVSLWVRVRIIMGVIMGMRMHVRVCIAMAVNMTTTLEHQRAHQVHGQSQHRDRNRLRIRYVTRIDQPLHRLDCDQNRHDAQRDRTGEPGEVTDLAGAERKARIAGVRAGIAVSKCRNTQRRGMRAHVPTVGDQSQRAVVVAAGNLADHHHEREHHHPARATFVPVVVFAQPGARAIGWCVR